MSKNENILLDATLRDVLDRNAFRAVLKNGHEIIVFVLAQDTELQSCGVGDFVKVEMSPFDMSKGRIINKIGTEQ
ncbi:translation initiation factor IF-1 [Verrucomicrobiota bacterium]